MQSLLYPNETRIEKVFNQLWFKPYMSLFGEMFKPGKFRIRNFLKILVGLELGILT